MKTIISSITIVLALCSSIAFLPSTIAYAQKDTVEFKFIPKYYPQDSPEFIPLPPPEIAYSPEILYPRDSTLQSKEADVWVNVLVNRQGIVSKAEVFKTTDETFNEYAIKYATQYTFKWSGGWPDRVKNRNSVWISIPIHFRQ